MLAKTKRKILKVAFFGDAEAKENSPHFKLAWETAKILAKAGFVIVNGGGPGVMLAATLGAESVGGKTEAVVIDGRIDMGENFEGQYKNNISRVDKKIVEENYPDRLNRLLEEADAYVIFNGGTGTISEIGMAWSRSKFDFGNHKPLIFIGDFWHEILDPIETFMEIDEQETSVLAIVETPEEVYLKIKECQLS